MSEGEDIGNLQPANGVPQEVLATFGPSHAARANQAAETRPDINAVISQIIDHGETVDNQSAGSKGSAAGIANSDGIIPLGASHQLKVQSLPILDNLVRSSPIKY